MTSIRGLSYPLQVQDGKLLLAEDYAILEQQIVSVLETRPFERIMRADYGLMENTFETINPAAIDSMISEAISTQVGGLDDLSVKGNWDRGENGVYVVTVSYSTNGVPQPPLTLSLVI